MKKTTLNFKKFKTTSKATFFLAIISVVFLTILLIFKLTTHNITLNCIIILSSALSFFVIIFALVIIYELLIQNYKQK